MLVTTQDPGDIIMNKTESLFFSVYMYKKLDSNMGKIRKCEV